jgi:hypothetical protein
VRVPGRIGLVATLAAALSLAACGGGGGGGGGGDDGGEDLPESASASSEDEEGTLYPLSEGRYRLSYNAPDCEEVRITVTSAEGEVIYDQAPRTFTTFISNLPAGEYAIAMPECDEWTVDLTQM